MKTEQEEKYMQRCLQLAAIGGGFVAPNPMVGAVVVHNDIIIGEGYHVRYGALHAEPKAIYAVKEKELLKESTLYVNLEPCSHYGKTPPCANLIVETGIPRVVIGTLDPNPKVSGRGVKILEKAGIEVKVGVLEDECNSLNKRFLNWQKHHRPYIYLKWAQTKDGFMDAIRNDAETKPLQISNPITRQLTHKFRSENQAIMVSTNTVLLDNPSLTVRNWTGKNPVRIALDRTGRIPENFNILDNGVKTLIFTEKNASHKGNTELIHLNFEKDALSQVMKHLADRNIHSVLVEGGSKLLHSMINENLWDEINIEISEKMIENGVAAPVISGIPHAIKEFDNHQWISYINHQKHE